MLVSQGDDVLQHAVEDWSPIELNENNLNRKHLVIPRTTSVQFGEAILQTRAIIDCGVSGLSVADEEFARHHSLLMTRLQQPPGPYGPRSGGTGDHQRFEHGFDRGRASKQQ